MLINYDYKISTDIFKLDLEQSTDDRLALCSMQGHFTVICPRNIDFNRRNTQLMLGRYIVEGMREEVRRVVVPRLRRFSLETGLSFNRSFVRQSHSKWGSCSSSGNIGLSLFLMVLPSQYIDYVLLHELCHRREMNHGAKFWALLDTFTAGRAKQLRSGLNQYSRNISPLLVPLVTAIRYTRH